jgi:cell division protein FtsL
MSSFYQKEKAKEQGLSKTKKWIYGIIALIALIFIIYLLYAVFGKK